MPASRVRMVPSVVPGTPPITAGPPVAARWPASIAATSGWSTGVSTGGRSSSTVDLAPRDRLGGHGRGQPGEHRRSARAWSIPGTVRMSTPTVACAGMTLIWSTEPPADHGRGQVELAEQRVPCRAAGAARAPAPAARSSRDPAAGNGFRPMLRHRAVRHPAGQRDQRPGSRPWRRGRPRRPRARRRSRRRCRPTPGTAPAAGRRRAAWRPASCPPRRPARRPRCVPANPPSCTARAAWIIAATPDFMSAEPRPRSRPSTTSPAYGIERPGVRVALGDHVDVTLEHQGACGIGSGSRAGVAGIVRSGRSAHRVRTATPQRRSAGRARHR